jgi:hypothetical protein
MQPRLLTSSKELCSIRVCPCVGFNFFDLHSKDGAVPATDTRAADLKPNVKDCQDSIPFLPLKLRSADNGSELDDVRLVAPARLRPWESATETPRSILHRKDFGNQRVQISRFLAIVRRID